MLPNEKQSFMRQVAAFAKSGVNTPQKAEYAVTAILEGWLARNFPKLAPEERASPKKYHNNPFVTSLVEWIAEQPFLEATFWLSSAYVILAGKEQQTRLATYFTPPILADRLIDNLVAAGASLEDHIWMDPACGGGAFLTPVALRMASALREKGFRPVELLDRVAGNLIGFDIAPVLAELSRNFILMALYEDIASTAKIPPLKISVGDSLLCSCRNLVRPDVVICNPPYRKMAKKEVDVYREDFENIIEGQPNLYAFFMQQCIWMGKSGSRIGLLTPTSYLSGQSFSKLRTAVLQNTHVAQFDLVREKEGIFLGVEQETALSVFMKHAEGQQRPLDGATQVYVANGPQFEAIGSCVLPGDGVAWSVPRNASDSAMLLSAGTARFRLLDYGFIIRTGSYVYYRDERKTYKRRPNNQQMKAVFPLIWSSDITPEGTLIHGRTSVEDDHPTYIDMGDQEHQSVIRVPCLALQRVTSADQGRRLVSAPVSQELLAEFGGVVGENHVIFLVPASPEPLVRPDQLSEVLRSQTVDRLFRCVSGAVNVSKFELEQLPLPCPHALSRALDEHLSVDAAVDAAYGQHGELN